MGDEHDARRRIDRPRSAEHLDAVTRRPSSARSSAHLPPVTIDGEARRPAPGDPAQGQGSVRAVRSHTGPRARTAFPQPRTAAAEVDDGAGHVGVATLIQADAVGMGEPEHRRQFLGVDELFGVDHRRHGNRAYRRHVLGRRHFDVSPIDSDDESTAIRSLLVFGSGASTSAVTATGRPRRAAVRQRSGVPRRPVPDSIARPDYVLADGAVTTPRAPDPNDESLRRIRQACAVAAEVLLRAGDAVRPA